MKRLYLVIVISLLLLLGLISPVMATDTWQYYFPMFITDNSSTSRTNLPVLLGIKGADFAASHFVNSSATDTRMKQGTTDEPYIVSTTQVPVVVPSLPASSTVVYNLYTGYSPVKTLFPIITGTNGYITVPTAASLNMGDNFTDSYGGYINNTVGGVLKDKPNAYHVGFPSVTGTVEARIGSTSGYPLVDTANTSSSGGANVALSVSLPAGYVSGDLLIVLVTAYNAGSGVTLTAPAGWTQVYQQPVANGANYMGSGVWYKVSSGAEANPQTWTVAPACTFSAISYRIDNGTYVPGYAPTASSVNGTAGNPDCPSLTTGWGSVATLWLAPIGSNSVEGAAPAGYSNFLGVGAGGYQSYSAQKTSTAASENPPAYGSGATLWVAGTVGIRSSYSSVTAAGVTPSSQNISVSYVANQLSNSGLEAGAGLAGWSSTFGGATATANMTIVHSGLYSIRVVGAAVGDSGAYQAVAYTGIVSAGEWVWCATPNTARIFVGAYSSFHPGDSQWHFLSVFGASYVPANNMSLVIDGIGAVAYFDDGIFAKASSLPNQQYNLNLYHNGSIIGQTAVDGDVTVPVNASDYTMVSNNVMPYADNLTVSIGGNQKLYYAPTVMLTGTTLPDRSPVGTNTGTIHWGTNDHVVVTYGAMVGFAGTSLPSSTVSGFTVPSVPMPAQWYANGGSLATLPFYDAFNDAATASGIPVQTLFMFLVLGLAVTAVVIVVEKTRSMLLGVIVLTVIMVVGAIQTIIPLWMVYTYLIIAICLMYLYLQFARGG